MTIEWIQWIFLRTDDGVCDPNYNWFKVIEKPIAVLGEERTEWRDYSLWTVALEGSQKTRLDGDYPGKFTLEVNLLVFSLKHY